MTSETTIQNQIRCELSKYGVVIRLNSGYYKTLDGARTIKQGIKGLPDLLFVGDRGQTVWIECKTEKGELKSEQKRFIERLTKMGHVAGIARTAEDALKLIGRESKL